MLLAEKKDLDTALLAAGAGSNGLPGGMAMSTPVLWKRFQQHRCQVPALGLSLDVSRMRFEDGFLERMAAPMQRAFQDMDSLENGAVANPDEKRMVGHYWLRAPDLAP